MQRSVRVFSTNSARRTLTRYAPTGVEEEVWPPCQGVKGCVNEVSGRTHDAHASGYIDSIPPHVTAPPARVGSVWRSCDECALVATIPIAHTSSHSAVRSVTASTARAECDHPRRSDREQAATLPPSWNPAPPPHRRSPAIGGRVVSTLRLARSPQPYLPGESDGVP